MAERKKVTPLQGVRAVSTPAARAIDIHAAPTQTGLEDVVSSLKSLNPKLMDYGVAKQDQIDKEALAQINYLAQEFKNDNKGGMVNAAKIGEAYPQHSPIINGKIAEILGGQHAETMVRSKMQELFANAKIRQDGDLRGGFYKDVIDEIHAETKDRPFYSAGAIAKAETLIKQFEANFVQQEAIAKHQIQVDGFNATIDSILTNPEITGKAEEIEIQFQNYVKTSSLTNEEMKSQIVDTIIDRGIMSYANQELSEAVIGVFTDDGELIGGSLPEKFRNDPEVLEKLFQASEKANEMRVSNDARELKLKNANRTIEINKHSGIIKTAQIEASKNNTNATITHNGEELTVTEYITKVVDISQRDAVLKNATTNANVDLDVTESNSNFAKANLVDFLYTTAMFGFNIDNIPDDAAWKDEFIEFFGEGDKPFNQSTFNAFVDSTSTLRLKEKTELQDNTETYFANADLLKTSTTHLSNQDLVRTFGSRIEGMGKFADVLGTLEGLEGRSMDIPEMLTDFHNNYFKGLLIEWASDPKNKGRPGSEELKNIANEALDRTREEFREWETFVSNLGAGQRPDLNNTDVGMPLGQELIFDEGEKDDLGNEIENRRVVVVETPENYDFKKGKNLFKYVDQPGDKIEKTSNTEVGGQKLELLDRRLIVTEQKVIGSGNTSRLEEVIKDLNLGDRASEIAQRWLNLRRNNLKMDQNQIWDAVFEELGIDPNNRDNEDLRSAFKTNKEIINLIKKGK